MNKRGVPVHTDVTRAQMKKDENAVNAIVGWLEEVNPFDATRDSKIVVSFSTGFSSTPDDPVNADQAEEVGRAVQAKMNGKTVLDTMETKHKMKSLESLRSEPKVNGKKLVIDSLKLFSRCLRTTVVFDGYGNSTKDHDHLRRTKNACCDILIRPDIKSIIQREKFLDNKSNKIQLIRLLAETFGRNGISVKECPDDADTSFVRAALDEARESRVEVKAEDTDIMVLLIHHAADHPIFLTTAKETSYDVGKIREALPDRYRKYLISVHSFSGCDTVSAISGFSKSTFLAKLCKTDKAEKAMDGCELFHFMFRGNRDLGDLADLRFDIFSKRAAAGSIKPEKLPPTTKAAAHHSLRAYLQTRDWLLLETPSLDVLDYGWKLGDQGYEPVPTT